MKYIDLDKGIFTDPVDGTEYICHGYKLENYLCTLACNCTYEHIFGLIGYTCAKEYNTFLIRNNFNIILSDPTSEYNFAINGTMDEVYRLADLLNKRLSDIYDKGTTEIKLEFE